MKDLFLFAIGAIAVLLFLVDQFLATAGSPEVPTDCADEDVPVVPTVPTVTWWLDKDGKIHGGKNN